MMSNVDGPYLTLDDMRVYNEAREWNSNDPMAGEMAILFQRVLFGLRERLEPGVPYGESKRIRPCNDMRGIVEGGVSVAIDIGGEAPKRLRFKFRSDRPGERLYLMIEGDGAVRTRLDPADGLRIAQAVNALVGFG